MKRWPVVVAAGIALALVAAPTSADPVTWETPWREAKAYALAQCAKTFKNYQLQEVCLQNEREGHRALQGDYGLPSDVAQQAKRRCAEVFNQFQLQDVCMQNEAESYRKLYGR